RAGAALVWVLAALALTGAAWTVGMPPWRGALAVGVALLVVAALLRRVTRRLGGVTGDVYGAAVEVTLTAMLVALG
ncbi:adenosylcobinamide-GDP ribazoletransferase, partial [Mycobacterium sp. PS03-16]|uniref:adenosylcobinamide-GDP ribazoletransferase n=1 Tax=Mycobacterium sp. PS03-16 TaxID=2559611 RepID=UPI001104AFD2